MRRRRAQKRTTSRGSALRRVALYSAGPIVGGAERSMLFLAAAYRGDLELVVLSPSPSVIAAAAAIAPDVERRLVQAPSGPVAALRSYRRAFAEFDLLQITLPNPYAERVAQAAGFSLRVPVVTVEQLVIAPRRRRGAILKRLWSLPVVATVAVGRRTADDLHRLFRIPRRKIHVVYNGVPDTVPTDRVMEARPVIGCVGRYEEQKGIDRLIRAVVELPDARLVLVGDGSLRAEYARLSSQLGVSDRVEIRPWADDARAMIAAFDVFALASRDEAFPLTIVEAMLAGTPVVAADVGSVSEAVIHERTGLLVRSGDHGELVAALRRLLDETEFARSLGQHAMALARQRFTDQIMAVGYDEVWRVALG